LRQRGSGNGQRRKLLVGGLFLCRIRSKLLIGGLFRCRIRLYLDAHRLLRRLGLLCELRLSHLSGRLVLRCQHLGRLLRRLGHLLGPGVHVLGHSANGHGRRGHLGCGLLLRMAARHLLTLALSDRLLLLLAAGRLCHLGRGHGDRDLGYRRYVGPRRIGVGHGCIEGRRARHRRRNIGRCLEAWGARHHRRPRHHRRRGGGDGEVVEFLLGRLRLGFLFEAFGAWHVWHPLGLLLDLHGPLVAQLVPEVAARLAGLLTPAAAVQARGLGQMVAGVLSLHIDLDQRVTGMGFRKCADGIRVFGVECRKQVVAVHAGGPARGQVTRAQELAHLRATLHGMALDPFGRGHHRQQQGGVGVCLVQLVERKQLRQKAFPCFPGPIQLREHVEVAAARKG